MQIGLFVLPTAFAACPRSINAALRALHGMEAVTIAQFLCALSNCSFPRTEI